MLEEKFWSMSYEWQIIINTWSNLEYIDLYGHDNHLELYKIIVNTLKSFKNRCRRDGTRNTLADQN